MARLRGIFVLAPPFRRGLKCDESAGADLHRTRAFTPFL
jgi:hypothetical protein